MAQVGKFVISIDHEFAWGYADHDLSDKDKARIVMEAGIVKRLITLFEKYNVGVTWAVVGHLIDRGCPWEPNKPHPEYPRPIHVGEERDWFKDHPKMHVYDDALWYDTENLVSSIRSSSAGHDIASHSYAHILYDEKKTSEESVKADLKNLGRVHRVHDVPLTSFIFPRNVEGYHRQLKVNGFTNYRGVSPKWYDNRKGFIKRIAHLLDYYIPVGRSVIACNTKHRLINIPDSMLLIGRNGLRKLVLKRAVIKKAIRGLRRASKRNEVFHLWFHPSNFSYETDKQFSILEEILKEATKMEREGKIEIMTMEGVAEGCGEYV